MKQGSRLILITVGAALLGVLTGFLIGWFSRPVGDTKPKADSSVSKELIDGISAENLEENLRILTAEPHIAGRDVDEVTLVDFIKKRWKDYGFEVEVHPYDVLLSYPEQNDSNVISVLLDNDTEILASQPSEKILDDSQISDKVVNPFNAYSATGDVEGYLVYVNYATVDDFIELTRDLNVDPSGHICISRYGKIFRGNKALHAQQYGCIGLILYSDPIDCTVPWGTVYPDDWFLPGTGAQRGSLHLVKGDPLTPQYPAIETAWRMQENETELPKIPVTPIGYDDAVKYLNRMGGDEVPDLWKGGLKITYRLGPGFMGEMNNTSKMKMHVTTKNQRATAHNIFGYIRGSVEPDRYVLLGNHRDAWVFGAMDPSSGTAAMVELARVVGNAVKNGWKPRRTIVFCSWGAEEYGIIGSTEWVEEFQKLLASRSVAYLNLDTAVTGNYTLLVHTLPNLNEVIFESTKAVQTPFESEIGEGRKTFYDTWRHRMPKNSTDPHSVPRTNNLGSGSDFTPFVQITGISSVFSRHIWDPSLPIKHYPVYHTVYETFDFVMKFVDPGCKIIKAHTQMHAELLRRLVDSPILPLNCVDYAKRLEEDMEAFIDAYGTEMENNRMDIDHFRYAVSNFTAAAKDIHRRIEDLDTSNEFALRLINDQLMQLDRAFIDMNGIGKRINFRHVIYAPSLHDTYASAAFPGVVDALFDIDADPNQAERWEEVRRQYSILLYHIGSAASTLRDVVPVKGYSNY